MVFHWRFSDSIYPQVFRTLLSILAVLNIVVVVVWMVSTHPPTSKSSSPFNNPLVTVPKAPITNGMIVTFMSHSFFFQFSSKVVVVISLFTFFQFYCVVSRNSKVNNLANSLFLLIIIRSGLLAEIIIIIIYSFEFFTSVFPDGLSLEIEWQQVSSTLQDSSRYSGRSQYCCCGLDGLHSAANFQILQAL